MTQRKKSQQTNRWTELRSALEEMFTGTQEWRQREWEIFFEVETILHLYERLIPSETGRTPQEAWALVSGYCIRSINAAPEQRRMCLLLRERLYHLQTASAWKWWLRWYAGLPEEWRLYGFTDDPPGFVQHQYEPALRSQRLAVYEELFQQTANDPMDKQVVPRPATAGTYSFQVAGTSLSIEISEAMASTFGPMPYPYRELRERVQNPPIWIDLDKLVAIGKDLDALEAQSGILPCGNWQERLKALKVALFESENPPVFQRTFCIDDLFHLVGMLGVGKSTLIWALTYHLAANEHRHITVVLNTVVEAIRLSAWLRKLGVAAAPALGRNWEDHARKYGLANAETLNPERVFKPDFVNDLALRWMPVPCALSGPQSEPIPRGKEPCWSLIGTDGNRYRCPLLSVCPVPTINRDLVESSVWVVNPKSFLYSSSPEGIGSQRMRLLEAVYRLSDLVIVDEADRVQVQWDGDFAPTEELAGSDGALLDHLHSQLPRYMTGRGRRNAANSVLNRLTQSYAQAHLLSNQVFRLIAKTSAIAKWIDKYQITNVGIFDAC